MKLHIGCGGSYRKGWLNADAFDTTVADKKLFAEHIDLPDGSCTVIAANHLIEHLGYFGAVRFFGEAFRLLEKGGMLHLKTPDIALACEAFAKGDRAERMRLSPWIYGTETAGQRHAFCFDRELLRQLLEEAGFSEIKVTRTEPNSGFPELTASARRESALAPFVTAKARKLAAERLPDLWQDEETAFSAEQLLAAAEKILRDFLHKREENPLARAPELCASNPALMRCFFTAAEENGLLKDEGWAAKAATLERAQIQKYAYTVLLKQNAALAQDEAFDAAYTAAAKKARKLLEGKAETTFFGRLKDIDTDAPEQFDWHSVQRRSLRLAQRGVKLFAQGRHDDARSAFASALAACRDNAPAHWNMARLCALAGDTDTAQTHYVRAQKLFANQGLHRSAALVLTEKNEIRTSAAHPKDEPASGPEGEEDE